jgi:hypothetical protein
MQSGAQGKLVETHSLNFCAFFGNPAFAGTFPFFEKYAAVMIAYCSRYDLCVMEYRSAGDAPRYIRHSPVRVRTQ